MWERFSYYGMRALLILFMTAAPAAGGLGFDTATAGAVYGLYTSMVYMTSLPGGWLADRLIGQRRAVLWGGILIASGHFSMAFPSISTFYLGLMLIVLGTGLLKGNISVLVGKLYAEGDERRDAGFSIYYMGINLGAFIAPLVCGFLGQRVSWHAGFAAAGVGMALGVVQYVVGGKTPGDGRPGAGAGVVARSGSRAAPPGSTLGRCGRRRAGVDCCRSRHRRARNLAHASRRPGRRTVARHHRGLLRLAVLRRRLDSGRAPAPVCDRRLLPGGGALLVRVRTGRVDAQPVRRSQHEHVALRLRVPEQLVPVGQRHFHHRARAGVRMALAAPRAAAAVEPDQVFFRSDRRGRRLRRDDVRGDRGAAADRSVSPNWLLVTYLLHTVGELCLSPVGLSSMTKLAPARVAGLMMGVWFLAASVGNFFGGRLASFYEAWSLPGLFGGVAAIGIVSGLIMLAFSRPIKRLMGEVR